MPKVTTYTRNRIQTLHESCLQPVKIFQELKSEGLSVSYASVARIVNKLKLTGSIENRARSGRPRKLNDAARAFIEEQMRANDETTSCQIQKRLQKRGFTVHASTVRRSRKEQGWTLQNTRYCQMIREANKAKRLEYAQKVLDTGDTFHNVVFSDECSISLQQFRRTCYRKIDEPAKRKPKPKHPLKVHVWAGISRHGATKICIFEGIMEAPLYCSILESTLIPFLRETLPDHRFMQDNDPKHTSRLAKAFLEENEINWWRTPPESPDLNPIEMLWHELKFYLESRVKPTTKQELIDGIKRFWSEKVTSEKCNRYIDHVLREAIPEVIVENGGATKH